MTKQMTLLAAILVTTAALLTPAQADWNPGDPYKMHYPQLPDMSPTGLDVLATYGGFWFDPAQGGYQVLGNKILADDFLCTESGPITDIHIWGSWLYNAPDPNGYFHLSIHSDIPDPDGTGPLYSMPGNVLWSKDLSLWQERVYGTANEQFYDPNTGRILGPDNVVFQYNFLIDPIEAYQQQAGTIYWLDVQFVPNTPTITTTNLFGWKTSLNHFNDDAVFGDNLDPGGDPLLTGWMELVYPPGHPLQGQSMDMAFVITTPEPSPALLAGLAGGLLLILRRWRKRQESAKGGSSRSRL